MNPTLKPVGDVIKLTKKQAAIEINKSLISVVMYAKKGSRLVSTKVYDLQDLIQANAKQYGKKIEYDSSTGKIQNTMEANLIREYTLALEKITKQYDDNYQKILEQKLELEGLVLSGQIIQSDIVSRRDEYKKAPEYAKEQKLREEVVEALQNGDYSEVATKNAELLEISEINKATQLDNDSKNVRAEIATIKEEIEKCEELLNECENNRRQCVQLITSNVFKSSNEKALMVIEKQSWAKKAWSKVLNIINGDKRYMNNVINPLSKKIRDISYKSMPSIRKELQEKTVTLEKTAKEKITNLKYINVIPNNNTTNKEEKSNKKVSKQSWRTTITTARDKISWRIAKTEEQVYKENNNKELNQKENIEVNEHER